MPIGTQNIIINFKNLKYTKKICKKTLKCVKNNRKYDFMYRVLS